MAARTPDPKQAQLPTSPIQNAHGYSWEMKWDILPPRGTMPEPRCGHTLSLLGPVSPFWDPVSMVPNPSGSAPPAVGQNKLVVAFGETAKNVGVIERKYFGDVFSFDGLEWSLVKTDYKRDAYIPNERADHSACAFGGQRENLFFFGGRYKHSYLDDSFVLSGLCSNQSTTPRWVPIYSPQNPSGRRGHSITQLFSSTGEEGLLLFGGERGSQYLQDLWHFDPAKQAWTKLGMKGDLPSARALHSAFSPQRDLLVLVGGHDAQGVAKPDMFLFDVRVGAWTKSRTTEIPKFSDFTNSHLLSGGKELLILNPQQVQTVSLLNSDMKSQKLGECVSVGVRGKPPEARVRLASCLVQRDASGLSHRLFVFGGWKKEMGAQALSGGLRSLTITKTPLEIKTPQPVRPELASPLHPTTLAVPNYRVTLSNTPVKCRAESSTHHKFVTSQSAALKDGCVISASLQIKPNDEKSLPSAVIERLLVESQTSLLEPNTPFFLSPSQIMSLIQQARNVFINEPSLLELPVPAKVFGDIHGQFADLIRLFRAYGQPESKLGDIGVYRYVFVGDFVDRGPHSLEVMCLLLALKVRYPQRVFLIRGNHEDRNMNKTHGFWQECRTRIGTPLASGALQVDPKVGEDIWEAFCNLFCFLPLGALVGKKILCVHGGIGSFRKISQIAEIKRPIEIDLTKVGKVPEMAVAADILWSDPADNEDQTGLSENPVRRVSVVFGADIVRRFCKENDIDLIIRAHQCVKEGFEYFADGHLITVFSATNYCGRDNNCGALLEIVPLDPDSLPSSSSAAAGAVPLVVTPKSILPLNNVPMTWTAPKNDPTSPMRKGQSKSLKDFQFIQL